MFLFIIFDLLIACIYIYSSTNSNINIIYNKGNRVAFIIEKYRIIVQYSPYPVRDIYIHKKTEAIFMYCCYSLH